MKSMRYALVALTALFLAVLPASAADYEIDGVHSSAIFKVKHFGTSNFYGAFKSISGTVSYDPAELGKSSINVTIDATSVDSRMGQRDDHIKSPDFLSAGEFPKITFKSTGVSGSGSSFEVTGNLTLRGVTKEITATVEKTGEGTNPMSKKDIVGFEARFTIDRTEFGVNYMPGALSNEVDFILAIEAAK